MVFAVMADGSQVPVAPGLGATIGDVVRALTTRSLTGSAVPLRDAVVTLADGRKVPYGDLSGFAERDA